jgi:hypothetical protein
MINMPPDPQKPLSEASIIQATGEQQEIPVLIDLALQTCM